MSTRRSGGMPGKKKDSDGKPLCRWCSGPVPKPRRSWCSDKCVEEALIVHSPVHTRKAVFERDKGVCACCGLDTDEVERKLRRLRCIEVNGLTAYDTLQAEAYKRWNIRNETDHQWDEHSRLYDIVYYLSFLDKREKWNGKRIGHKPLTTHGRAPILDEVEIYVGRVHERFKRLAGARLGRLRDELRARGFHTTTETLWNADHIKPVAEGGGLCGLDNYQTLCIGCHKAKTAEQAARKSLARRGPDPQQNLF